MVHHGRVSPVSRGRRRRNTGRTGPRVVRPALSVVPEPCDCPACSGEDVDPQDSLANLTSGAAELLEVDDPLEAELFGAALLAAGDLAGEGFAEALADGLVPAIAAAGTPESLAMLLALDAAGDVPAAAEAAGRLTEAGVPLPAWAGEVSEPVRVGDCRQFRDSAETASMLLCRVDRAARSHGFIVQVDHTDCDAAADILLFPAEMLSAALDAIRSEARAAGVSFTEEALDPAEFRWQVERALDARAVHDREDGPVELAEDDDAGPGYHPLAVLLRTRIQALPVPPRPPAPHGSGDQPAGLAALALLAQQRGRPAATPKLPPKRKKSDGPAPILQIKVSLRGAKPPIWRRLELPADTSLARLHAIIQVAFGWDDRHLHVFETPYGSFGTADRELGHRAEAPVTLEQIGDRFQYTYDFGDDWTHDIVVEKALDREPVAYPRCTGGRRAAPPDDCGGVWGYAELVEVLGDPRHPDHQERLDWFGLESAADFQPARFDAAEITQALTGRPGN